ncbi:hypothetical protein Tco_1219480 [Tanacetum coccineum]
MVYSDKKLFSIMRLKWAGAAIEDNAAAGSCQLRRYSVPILSGFPSHGWRVMPILATDWGCDIQDDVDLKDYTGGVPLRRKRLVHRRARTEFNTSAFTQFHAPLSADVLSQAAVSASAGPSGVADKGKAPMPELDIPAEFVAEDAQARKRFEDEQASERLVQRLRAEDLAQEYMPNNRSAELMMQVDLILALARELLGAESAMDSAGSHHELGISPFADSANSSSLSPISTDHIPIDVLFEPTLGGINEFFLDNDEDEQIGMSRVAADPDSDDEVETISESASSPPRSRRKHRRMRSDDSLWDKPVEDFFSFESESDDDWRIYSPIHCLPLCLCEGYLLLLRRRMNWYFWLNPDVDVGLDLWRDVNLLCQSLHSDDVEDFWRTQDDWIVSSWKLYPKSSVHVLDLTNGKTVYMFIDRVYPIRATLLERMLRHKLTVPPSYCRDVVVAGSVIQMVQAGLRESYECLASAPLACTARQMVFSSPWLTAKKESGSPLQTALVCNSNPLIAGLCQFAKKLLGYSQFTFDSRSVKLELVVVTPRGFGVFGGFLSPEFQLGPRRCCCSFDSAVHRVHAVSFDAAVASTSFAAWLWCAGYIVMLVCAAALLCSCCFSSLFLRERLSRNLELTGVKVTKFRGGIVVPAGSSSSIPADYVSVVMFSFMLTEIESFEHEHVVMISTPAELSHHHLIFMYPEIKTVSIKRAVEEICFRHSFRIWLVQPPVPLGPFLLFDFAMLVVLFTGTSQSRHNTLTQVLFHIESASHPTASAVSDDDMEGFPFVFVTSIDVSLLNVLAESQDNASDSC